MRDLAVTAIVLATLPFCLARPWVGVLAWSWIGYMNPHRLAWGFAYTMPFAQLVALATLAGVLFMKDRRRLPRTIEVYLLILLWGLFLMSTLHAVNPDEAWDQLTKISKILLMMFLTLILFQDLTRLRTLLYVIALSIGFFGLKGGLWALLTGGGNQVLGPADSFIAGNTEIGMALVMVLPILRALSWHESRWWLRSVLKATFFFSIIAVLITYSRGAVLGLAVVLPLILLKRRAKVFLLPLVIAAYVAGPALMASLMPAPWLQRMGTLDKYEADQSARMRLNSWYVAYRLALDHPFVGAGFRPFSPEIYLTYSPDEQWNTDQDAHSIYLQVLAEHGFTGLALYVGVVLCTLRSLQRAIRKSRGNDALRPFHDMARMLVVSLIGFLVTGLFLSMSYFDLFFHLVAIAVLLQMLLDRPTHAPSRVPVATVKVRPSFVWI